MKVRLTATQTKINLAVNKALKEQTEYFIVEINDVRKMDFVDNQTRDDVLDELIERVTANYDENKRHD